MDPAGNLVVIKTPPGSAQLVGFALDHSQLPQIVGTAPDAVRRVEDAIAEAVAALIEADLDDDHRRSLAHAIVGMAEGVIRNQLATGQRIDPERLGRQLAELAWAGLRGVRPL